MQSIVYGQFLPVVLGENTMEMRKLNIDMRSTYVPRRNPSIKSSFATAAYRFGHTLIQGTVDRRDVVTKIIDVRKIRELICP